MPTLWEQAQTSLRPNTETAGDPGQTYALKSRMATHNVSAVSIALITDGQVEVDAAYGTRAADDPVPVTARTRFAACSVSKAVAAVAALRLVADGRLPLDADVNEHVRDWRVRDAVGQPVKVTLRQLLTHTAGLNVGGAVGYDPAGPVPTLDDVFHGRPPSLTPAVHVVAEPGTAYRYSAGGYIVVQRLICDATGKPFDDAVRALVFEPLAMDRSTFAPQPDDDDHAAAHVSMIRRGSPETNLVWPEQAAAGLWTTAGDLVRLTVAIQASYHGRGDFLPQALAGDALLRQTPHRDVGLGLHLLGDGAARRFSHTRSHLGWRAEMLDWLDRECGVAVMISNGYTGSELKGEILKAVLSTYQWPT